MNSAIKLKHSKGKGRGLFARKALKKGDLLIVEKAVGQVTQYKRGDIFKGGLTELVK